MAILDKLALAGYFLHHHNKKFNRKVSPIKFQKGMYFLFAFWAQQTNRITSHDKEGVSESLSLDSELFNADFEAWQYGPVDRGLYTAYKNNTILSMDTTSLANNIDSQIVDTVISFIDDMLLQIYDINDFSLVEISHEDNTWIKTYANYPNGNGKMNSTDIIKEYTQ